jgi:hypothetical protein
VKQVFTFLVVLITTSTFAQKISFYRDSTFTHTYTKLGGTVISVNNGQHWDDPDYNMSIGFNFKFFGDSSSTLYFDALNGVGASFNLKPTPADPIGKYFSVLTTFGADLINKDTAFSGSRSPITSQTSGMFPNRIFKLQFDNAGFYTPYTNGNLTDSIDFQLWLYETTNIIETRFGPNNLVSTIEDLYDDGPGAWVGIYDSLYIDSTLTLPLKKGYTFNDIIANPNLDSANIFPDLLNGTIPGMTGNPTNGMVFRFIPSNVKVFAAGVKDQYLKNNTNITLNNNVLTILNNTNQKLDLNIIDMQGKSLIKKSFITSNNHLDVSYLPSAIYTVTLSNATSSITYKIAK